MDGLGLGRRVEVELADLVAVQAGGVDTIYPVENADLARRIAETGCRLSEQPMGLEPQARHFPVRNRLISGLAQAVVVIEAASRSGSLITAKTALDQGREVYAVPGHPFDARAGGCTCEEPPVEITSESCENGHGPDCPGARTVRVLHRQFCRLRLARAASTN